MSFMKASLLQIRKAIKIGDIIQVKSVVGLVVQTRFSKYQTYDNWILSTANGPFTVSALDIRLYGNIIQRV